jgi:hypothetical protein
LPLQLRQPAFQAENECSVSSAEHKSIGNIREDGIFVKPNKSANQIE